MINSKEDAITLHHTIIDWIKTADTKASIYLGFNGGILIFFLTNSQTILTEIKSQNIYLKCANISLFSIYILLLIFSLYQLYKVVNPDLKGSEDNNQAEYNGPKSNLFFGFIQHHRNSQEFIKDIIDKVEEKDTLITEEYLKQTYQNSKIVWKKFKRLGKATTSFFFSCIAAFLLIILTFVVNLL